MNRVESEADAAIAEELENSLADGGKQSESVQIDGRACFGNLDFDPTNIELALGGTQENVTAALSTLKRYWPDGNYPRPLASEAIIVVNNKVKRYQVRQVQGDKDNRAQLIIGLAAFTNQSR